jgi:hypothetical protein
MQRVFDAESDNLAADARAVAGRPEVAILERWEGGASFGGAPTAPVGWADDLLSFLGAQVQQQAGAWLREAIEQGARPGTPAHNLIYRGGKLLGHKFHPWQAVRWAERLNLAAQAGFFLFNLYRDFREASVEERGQQQAIQQLRAKVKQVADELVTEANQELEPVLRDFYGDMAAEDAALTETVAGRQSERVRITTALDEIELQATAYLRELRNPLGSVAE